MGHARTPAEAFAVARARNAMITMGIVCLAFFALLHWLAGLPGESAADAADSRTQATRMLVAGVVYLVLALGLHRVWTAAWVLAVLFFTLSLTMHLVLTVRYASIELAIVIAIELAVANRLLARDACRAFLRLRRRRRVVAEPEPEEPAWRMPTVAAFPMAQPVVEAPPPPPAPAAAPQAWPAASFDYFG